MATKAIPYRKLGKNGPSIPALGLGLMGLSYEAYGSISSDEERFAFLDRAYELGARNWDTADLYGDSEELLNKWFKRTGKRNDIFLATKFGFVKGSAPFELDTTGTYCKRACAKSLELLGVDSIDLYYVHHPNPKTPIEDSMRALAELQREGKIKHIGLSSVSSNTLRRAMKIAPVAAVQIGYSPFELDAEGEAGTNIISTCRELGVAIVAAMPLGRGLLTNTFANGQAVGDSKDMRTKVMPRFQEANQATNVKLVNQFKEFASKKGCTPSQLSLAWLLKQGDDIVPIPGTKKVKYLEENWGALDAHLNDGEEREIRRFVEQIEIAGHHMPDAFRDWLFRDTAEEL